MATASVLRTKLVVVGDWSVGKTAAVQQFLNAGTAFPKNYSMTLGGEVGFFSLNSFPLCQVSSKLVHIPDTSDAVELLILDCSGRKVIFLDHAVDRFEPLKMLNFISWAWTIDK